MFLVSRTYYAQLTIPFYEFCRPAEEILPIITTYLTEYLIAVFPDDVLKTVFCISILWSSEKAYHKTFVQTEIDIFHRAAADNFIDELDRSAISCCKFDCLCHRLLI